jgi:lysyl endopeptidase
MIPKRASFLSLSAILFLNIAVFAESSDGPSEQPAAFTHAVRPMTLVSPVIPEPVDLAAILQEEQQRPQGSPYRFAISRPARATPQNDGMWEDLDGSTMLWRLPINSPGALSLSLGFSRYHMPAGGKLFIYSADQRQVRGPFTSRDNRGDGTLDTPLIAAGSIIVELTIPLAEVPQLELELTRINHGFRPFGLAPPQYQALALGEAAPCNHVNNAACYTAEWGNQVRSVALCEVRLGKWSYGGTGTLLNNTAQDDRPHFLTAFHVLDNETEPRDLVISEAEKAAVEKMIVYWNFQAATCSGTSGSPSQSQIGATFRAGYWYTDFALVELRNKPAAQCNAYYAGWDRSSTALSGGVAVHHPRGDWKQVSREDNPLIKGSVTSSGVEHGTAFVVLKWETGMTEDGSSGCPFFALPGKRTIGQLIGGTCTCADPGVSGFGPLYRSWNEGGRKETRLSDWLDPLNKGVMYLDGKNPSSDGSFGSIVGTWTLNWHWGGSDSHPYTDIVFKADGTLVCTSSTYTGTWTQSGNSVSWTFTEAARYTGTLTSHDAMRGTMLDVGGAFGEWYATRWSP